MGYPEKPRKVGLTKKRYRDNVIIVRTIIDLTASQLTRVDQVAAREHISRAEAVRRAIDLVYASEDPRESVRAARRRAFGLWRDRGTDAVAYVDALRDEWTW
jgi:hypothetical protein